MAEPGALQFACKDLRDACLVLKMGAAVVGNAVEAEGRGLIVVTGANQGGKSSFLRAYGVAQLMMQAGMFVCAEAYVGERCTGLFTHYKREEDASLKSGKLDEELARLNDIADAIRPGGLFLSNESFASTNEREGSEIARQTVSALRERRIMVVAVTHLFDFAHRLAAEHRADTLFLRAERREDGSRSFKLVVGEALSTSFGQDLYAQVFGTAAVPG
jgi:DNA mismatch repair ATPase MutS